MSADRSRPSRRAFPVAAARLVASLYKLSLLLALAVVFLLPFESTNTLSARLPVAAGLLVVSSALATTLRIRAG